MRSKLLITLIFMSGMLIFAAEVTPDLAGEWTGPEDLMIDIASDSCGGVSVNSCGIFRTFGWADVGAELRGDSLFLKANDYGSPLRGRFRIASSDKLSGTIIIGRPTDDWYYSGNAELHRKKTGRPAFMGIIKASDYDALSHDRDLASEALSELSPQSYGYDEKRIVEKLLDAKVYPLTPEDMLGFRRVRSIQIDAGSGIFSYPYFKCRFRKTNDGVYFEKISGSQRKSGYIYRNTPQSLVFLGGWSVNNDPKTSYGSANSVAGTVYKIGRDRAIMICHLGEKRMEIYELRR